MKTLQAAILGVILGCFFGLLTGPARAHSGAPSGTVWMDGSTLSATSLNNTVAHIHNTFTAGIIDSHISPNAAIQHSKLAQPTLVSKAMGAYVCPWDGGACSLTEDTNVTSVTPTDAGVYAVTLDYTPTDSVFTTFVTPTQETLSAGLACSVFGLSTAAPHLNVFCHIAGTGTNSGFSLMVMDWN